MLMIYLKPVVPVLDALPLPSKADIRFCMKEVKAWLAF